MVEIIDREGVGRVCTDDSVDTLLRLAKDLVDGVAADTKVSDRCRALSAKLFSPEAAVKQITAALTNWFTKTAAKFVAKSECSVDL